MLRLSRCAAVESSTHCVSVSLVMLVVLVRGERHCAAPTSQSPDNRRVAGGAVTQPIPERLDEQRVCSVGAGSRAFGNYNPTRHERPLTTQLRAIRNVVAQYYESIVSVRPASGRSSRSDSRGSRLSLLGLSEAFGLTLWRSCLLATR